MGKRSWVGLVAAASVLSLMLFLRETPRADQGALQRDVTSGPDRTSAPASLVPSEDRAGDVRRDAPVPATGVEPSQASVAPSEPVRVNAAERHPLRIVLRGADGNEVQPVEARVELADAGPGEARVTVLRDTSRGAFDDVGPGRYVVTVAASAYAHRPRTITLDAADVVRWDDGEGWEVELSLYVAGEVAVLVRRPDGRPFTTYADERGLEPRRLFYRAFEAYAQLDAPASNARPASASSDGPRPDGSQSAVDPPARWIALRGGYRASVGECAVGALQLTAPPPIWVGLSYFGVHIGWQAVRAGDTSVTFILDEATLAAPNAHATVRFIDADGGHPLAGVKTTLLADTSSYRRKDLEKRLSDEDGSVRFEGLIPGRYELVALFGESTLKRRVDLPQGGRIDLGTFELRAGRSIAVRIVDVDGRPRGAWLETGPYAVGKRLEEVFRPNLDHLVSGTGLTTLRSPAEAIAVRATATSDGPSGPIEPTQTRSRIVLLDPNALPTDLELVVLEPRRVRPLAGAVPWPGASLEIVDDLGLVVGKAALQGRPTLNLQPGTYTTRVIDAAGIVYSGPALNLMPGEAPYELALP
ncbi:MAG: prealbumin-like fold domain-containing protein [Planctomycetota bacterium]